LKSVVEKVTKRTGTKTAQKKRSIKKKVISEGGLNTQKSKRVKKSSRGDGTKIEVKEEPMEISYNKEGDSKQEQSTKKRIRAKSLKRAFDSCIVVLCRCVSRVLQSFVLIG